MPYELISSLFSDYSYKQRWVYIPEGKSAYFRKDKVFDFPTGSALIKTFYYPIDEKGFNLGQETNGNEIIAEEGRWMASRFVCGMKLKTRLLLKAGKTILNEWIDFEGKCVQFDTESRIRISVKNVTRIMMK